MNSLIQHLLHITSAKFQIFLNSIVHNMKENKVFSKAIETYFILLQFLGTVFKCNF